MVVCSGGSEIKDNIPESLSITWDHMASLLPPELLPLAPFMPYLKPIAIASVSDFCSGEPPGWPSVSGLVFEAVLAGGEVGAGLVASQALAQILLNAFWYSACQCITGTTPALPTGPTLPPIGVLNPPIVSQPQPIGTCASYGPGTADLADATMGCMLVPQGSPATYSGAVYADGVVGIPPGAVKMTAHWDTGPFIATNHQNSFQQVFYNAAGTFISQSLISSKQSGDSGTVSPAIPSGATQFQCKVLNDSAATPPAATKPTYRVDFFCSASPNQPSVPCCPPDPILQGVLTQILNMVTLIQRQAAPFSYVYGANHTGLTGADELAVADLVGVSVDVTTIPDATGIEAGTPETLFGLGWINLGTSDGWTSSRRIDHDGSLLLPPQAGVFTRIGYSLQPGVVVSIRELVREP